MSIGYIVRNSGAGMQIDGEYKNFTLFESGTKSFDTTGWGMIFVDFTNTSKVPIFAFRPITTCFLSSGQWVKSGGDFSEIYTPIQKNYTGSFKWVLFTAGFNNGLPSIGRIIRNAKGQVVFSSNETYFKIKGVTSLNYEYTSYQDVTVQDAENSYFFLVHLVADPWVETASVYFAGLKKLTSTSLRVKHFSAGTATGPYLSGYYYQGLLVEVGT